MLNSITIYRSYIREYVTYQKVINQCFPNKLIWLRIRFKKPNTIMITTKVNSSQWHKYPDIEQNTDLCSNIVTYKRGLIQTSSLKYDSNIMDMTHTKNASIVNEKGNCIFHFRSKYYLSPILLLLLFFTVTVYLPWLW